jgi:hypothetical protein
MNVVPLAELACRETVALHNFFAAWFRDSSGTVDFAVCERSLAEDFSMIAPDGQVRNRASVVARLRNARGSAPSDLVIAVLDPHPVWQGAGAVLLEYVEQQYAGGRSMRRRSTGLFTRDRAAPHGVVWRHLQETWLAQEENV